MQFPQSIVYHYMDNILFSHSNEGTLERMFEKVKKNFVMLGITPEKKNTK